MKKLQFIFTIGFVSTAFFTLLLWMIGVLYDTPNDGSVHNLFRIMALLFVFSMGGWVLLFIYNDNKRETDYKTARSKYLKDSIRMQKEHGKELDKILKKYEDDDL